MPENPRFGQFRAHFGQFWAGTFYFENQATSLSFKVGDLDAKNSEKSYGGKYLSMCDGRTETDSDNKAIRLRKVNNFIEPFRKSEKLAEQLVN